MTSATRSLWPSDLKTEDVRSPTEILCEQADLLERQTNGMLTGDLVEHVVQDKNVISFDVTAPRIPTTVRLFEVHQSPKLTYPVRIIPPKDEIPDDLKKRVYRPGIAAMPVMPSLQGSWEERQWVADSAAEFTKKLEELLASSEVKSKLLSLLSRSKRLADKSMPPPSDSAA